jgi:hypothetical protein
MGLRRFTPTDTTASASCSCSGADLCNDIDPVGANGFPARPAARVLLTVVGAGNADCSCSSFSASSGDGELAYRVDGGSWTQIPGAYCNAVCSCVSAPDVDIGAFSDTFVVELLNVADLSTISVRAEANCSSDGDGQGSGDASITNWYIDAVVTSMVAVA